MINSEQKSRIAEMAKIYNSTMTDDALVDFLVEHCVTRALLYLGRDELANNLEILIAQAVAENFRKMETFSKSGENEQAIASLSDNGQSISYRNEAKRAMANASDSEIFEHIEPILRQYRRVDVVA